MDELFSGIQPGGEPAAPVEPAAPAEPAAPIEPAAPAAPAEPAPTAEEQADADEWAKIAEDMFPGLDDKKENKDEQADPNKDPAPTEAPAKGDEKSEPPKPDGEEADEAGEQTGNEDEPAERPELSASDRQQLESTVKAEISQKMFTTEVNGKSLVETPDGSKYAVSENGRVLLADADGDPIKSIDDVMNLINPRTGEPFTEEQAGMWLLNAQQKMRDNVGDMNARIEEIASTGISMKEESLEVAWQYGELLKAMPELQQELWSEYEKTLVKDPKTGIVVKAPVSLQRYYERALEPYARLGAQLEGQAAAAPATPAAPAAPATPAPDKAAEAQARQQRRADRSDIYGAGNTNTASDDDNEWGQAAQAVFGDQLNGLRR